MPTNPTLEVRYYSTHAAGRPPLSWELKVWDPAKSALKADYTDASPGGIADGFQWSVRGDGNCIQMRFKAKPSGVNIGPRDIVQLLVDGQPAFYGYVEVAWPSSDDSLREYVAVGAAELLKQRYMDRTTYATQDVASIVQDVISRLKHPAITYDPARVPTSGATISLTNGLAIPLAKIFDDLAASLKGSVTWGVDATGTFFFEPPSGSTSVGYEDKGLEWLPVEGDDVVTKVILVDNIPKTEVRYGDYEYKPMFPFNALDVVTFEYEAPEHAIYGAEKAFVYRGEMLRLNTDADRIAYAYTNLDAPLNALDCDDATYASATAFGDVSLEADLSTVAYGVLALVEIRDASVYPWISLSVTHLGANNVLLAMYGYSTDLITQSGKYPLLMYFPIPPGTVASKIKVYVYYANAADAVRVYRLCGLVPVDLTDTAKSLIRLPFQTPTEIRFDRYQAPAATLTVTGAPGGDISGSVEEWEYRWSSRRQESVARLGSRGTDPAARAIRILADQRRADAEVTALNLTRRK